MLEYRVALKELPAAIRPRERLRHNGGGALSTAELLAIVLRTGSTDGNVLDLSHALLARFGGLAGLDRASLAELCAQKGIGPVKAIELKAALELGRRLVSLNPGDRPQIRSPEDVANLLMPEMSGLGQEHLRTVLLDTKNHVLGLHDVYRGSLNSAVVRVGEVFREAIRQNCAAIVLVHNHPSGDPSPSPEDVRVTRQIAEAGELLDIEVLDHLIIGQQRYVSLKERRLGFA